MVIKMQIRLTLKPRLKPNQSSFCIPCGYNHVVSSMIYNKLGEIGVSDFWHDKGFTGSNGKAFKGFVFGQLTGKHDIGPDPRIPGSENGDHIFFHDTITLEIRSPLFSFIDELQRSFELNPTVRLYDTTLDIINAHLDNKHINSSTAVFQTETPILVTKPTEQADKKWKKTPVSPNEAEFFERICNNYEEKYETIFKREAHPIQIARIGYYKKKVVHYNGKSKVNNQNGKSENDKSYGIECYQCRIIVQGSIESLEFIYNTGLGEDNSGGFGMLKLLHTQ